MSIIKNLELKINGDEAKLSENIYVYQNDRGVELKLKLNSIRSSYYPTSRSLLFEDTEFLKELIAALRKMTPKEFNAWIEQKVKFTAIYNKRGTLGVEKYETPRIDFERFLKQSLSYGENDPEIGTKGLYYFKIINKVQEW